MGRRVMVVDDDPALRRYLGTLLRPHYEVLEVGGGEACLRRVNDFHPDVILLDICMPDVDGYETCRRVKRPHDRPTQVVMLTGRSSEAERGRAYQMGADNYLVKPVSADELFSVLRLHIRLHDALAALMEANMQLELHRQNAHALARERMQDVLATQDVALLALAKLADSRDSDTGEHLLRIRMYVRLLAEELQRNSVYAGQIDDQFIDDLYRSSPLHDIGKVGVSDSILLKPGRLTPDEFERMKDHVQIGAQTLEHVVNMSPSGSFLQMAAVIAREHHERWDGTGYPAGLRGQEISLAARIVALADVYDALTSDRVYKRAYDPELAREMILAEAGLHFDPVIVAAFERRFADFVRVPTELDRRAIQGSAEAMHGESREDAAEMRPGLHSGRMSFAAVSHD